MKDIEHKKMLKEAYVLLIVTVMVFSTIAVSVAGTNDNRAVSLTSHTKGSNHMIFGNERILSNEGMSLLWDNGDPDGRQGVSCMYWPPYDREIVDDFDIDETSSVGGGHFRMITNLGQPAELIEGVNVFFYEDISNEPSTDRYAERVAEFNAYNTGDYYLGRPEIAIDVSFDTVELATGKWWVCFQPVLYDNGFLLTSAGYGENIWCSYPDDYPKWTKGDIIFGYYYDVSFKLFRSISPPEIPQRPDGPSEGVVDVEYTFLSVTTDPEGEQVSYWWDWDDGTPGEWTDPYDSGVTMRESHIWTEAGTYNVTVKAKDVHDFESEWSEPKTVRIVGMPVLEIGNITGGLFKVTAEIKNGGGDATGIDWSITLEGGIILLGKETAGNIFSIPADDEASISSSLILGFGKTVVTVTAECAEGSSDTKTRDAFVLLFSIFYI